MDIVSFTPVVLIPDTQNQLKEISEAYSSPIIKKPMLKLRSFGFNDQSKLESGNYLKKLVRDIKDLYV